MTLKKITITRNGNVGFNHIICESCISNNYKLGDLFKNKDGHVFELMKIEYTPNTLEALYYLYDRESQGYKKLKDMDINLHETNKSTFYELTKIKDISLIDKIKKTSPWI